MTTAARISVTAGLYASLLLAIISVPSADAETLRYKSAKASEVVITPRWAFDGAGLSSEQLNTLVAELKAAELRFDMSRHLKSRVRIYLAIPTLVKGLRGTSGLRVDWLARGSFQAGSASPGSRALVFEGLVTTAELVEQFDFTLTIDARSLQGPLGFDPAFEIEVIGK